MSSSPQSEPQQRYHAFISYRHADNHAPGRQWATWLHQALETYEVPADLVGTQNSRGETIPSRIFPIFRDEDELPAHANLGDSIVLALELSELLLVICSPAAVASTYVANEIERFKQLGGSDRILAVIIDGEPNASWDSAKWGGRITAEHECFPEPLQFVYLDGVMSSTRAEPVAADFRVNHDGNLSEGWTSPEAYRQSLLDDGQLSGKAIDKRIASYLEQQQLMLLKIIAGVLAVPLGQLTRRDRAHQLKLAEQRARKLRRWLFAVSLLAITALLAGGVAIKQTRQAKQRTHDAQIAESGLLAGQSTQALKRADYEQALKLAVAGLPENLQNPNRSYAPEAEIAMVAAVYRDKLMFRDVSDPDWSDQDALRKQPYATKLLLEKSRLLLSGSAAPMLIDLTSFNRIPLQQRPSGGEHWSNGEVSADQQYFTASAAGNVFVWALNDGRLLLTAPGKKSLFAGQSKFIVVENSLKNPVSTLIDLKTKNRVAKYPGKVAAIAEADGFIIAELARNCTPVDTNATPRRVTCSPREVVKYRFTGEIEERLTGKLLKVQADAGFLLVTNEPRRRGSGSNSGSSQKKHTVTSIKLTDFTTKFVMTGEFELLDPDTRRVITRNRRSGTLSLWNMGNGEKLAEIEARLQRDEIGLHKGSVEVFYSQIEEQEFVVVSAENPAGKQVGRWYLQNGEPPEFQSGSFIGLSLWGGLVSSRESETSVEVFIGARERPAITMPLEHCNQSDDPGLSEITHPTMGNGFSSTVLFQCYGHLAMYFPDIGGMQFLQTAGNVSWVAGGDYFSVDNDLVTFWAPNHYQGGTGHVSKRLTVNANPGSSYYSLANGRYLLALDDLSGVRIWNFSESDATAAASLDEEDLQLETGQLAIAAESEAEFLRYRDKQLQTFAELGFSAQLLHDEAKQYRASFDSEPAELGSEWTLATPFLKNDKDLTAIGFSPEWQIQLDAGRRIVGIDSKAVLVDSKLQQPVLLSKSQRGQQFGIEWLVPVAPAGLQRSPDGNSWLFFNQFEVGLYNNSGQLLKSLCAADSPCEVDLNLQWVNGGAGLYHLGEAPSLFSIEQSRETDICQAYSSADTCRRLYSTAPLFGQRHIVTQYLMADLATGLPMRQLDESQLGFGGFPLRFNSDETAVLMAAENGGGTLTFSAWPLPERGQKMLEKANNRIGNVYTDDQG